MFFLLLPDALLLIKSKFIFIIVLIDKAWQVKFILDLDNRQVIKIVSMVIFFWIRLNWEYSYYKSLTNSQKRFVYSKTHMDISLLKLFHFHIFFWPCGGNLSATLFNFRTFSVLATHFISFCIVRVAWKSNCLTFLLIYFSPYLS